MRCKTGNCRDTQQAQRPQIQALASALRRATCFFLLTALAQAVAQVSVLDPSFQIGPGADNTVAGVIVQADGRILVGGEFTSVGGCSNSFLARLNADGLVDQSYNVAGQTDGPVGCMLQQSDRKLLVGGSFTRLLGQARTALARLLEDGSVDTTFDAGATIIYQRLDPLPGRQDDGRVLVGYTTLTIFRRTSCGSTPTVRLTPRLPAPTR